MSIKTFIKPKIKKFLKLPAVIRCLSFCLFAYSKFVGLTCRWQLDNVKNTLDKLGETNAVWVSWHSRATMMPFFWNKFIKRRMVALVSPHQDGQIIAHFLKWFHITPINGSTNENPRQSALELMRAALNGDNLFISPDGPRGPRMRMKKSPIYYAQKIGKPVICVCFSLNKAIVFEKAWDNTMIALPFGKGILALSDPIYIPAELTDDELENYRLKVENIANDLSIKCDKFVGREPTLPANPEDFKKKKG